MDNQGIRVKYPHQQLHQIPITAGPVYAGAIPISGGDINAEGIPISRGPVYSGGIPITGGEIHLTGMPITGAQSCHPAPLNHRPGYCEEKLRNQPQHNSIFAGSLIMIISGMHIGWTIWRFDFTFHQDRWLSQFITIHTLILITVAWFVMAIVGSVAGSLILPIITNKKKIIYWLCSAVLALSSVIMIIWYDDMGAMIVARMFAGAAHGVVYVVLLGHAAENAEQNNRGYLMSSLNLSLMTGTLVFAAIHTSLPINAVITVDRCVGIIGLVLSCWAALLTTFLYYESVPYLIHIGNDTKAIHNLLRLRTEPATSMKVHQDLQELKLMVSEDMSEDRNIFTKGNWRPLLLMAAIKVLAFCGNNWILNVIQIRIVAFVLGPPVVQFAPLILTSIRFVMSFVVVFVADLMPRKMMLVISGASTGAILLIIGILETTVSQRSDLVAHNFSMVFCFLHQLTVAFGIDPLQHILMSEAFPMKKKTLSITCVLVLEHVLQIIAISIFMHVSAAVTNDLMIAIPFTAALLILVITAVLYFTIPETVGMTLRQSRDKFAAKMTH